MSDKTENRLAWAVASLAIFAVSVASWTFIVPRVWLWFVVPLGAPSITWRTAWGLSLLLSLFRTPGKKDYEGRVMAEYLGGVVLGYWLIYGVAWVLS